MRRAQAIASIIAGLALCAANAAMAQEAQATDQPPTAVPQAQQERAAAAVQQPGKGARAAQPAPKSRPYPRRRSVQQIIATVPPPAVAPSWGPVLAPPAGPAPIPAPAAGMQPVYPPPPAPLNSCSGNLCTDSSGNTYNTGTGNAAINSQGRLCNRVGDTMQCF